MRILERRLHILLDETRYQRVSAEAKRRNVSVATVIRGAIDGLLASDDRRRRAIARILDAEPMPVPADPRDLRRELDIAHERNA